MKRKAGLEYCFYTSVTAILLTIIYTIQSGAESTFVNPIKSESLEDLLIKVLDGFVTLLIPIMVLAIVYTGFMMVLKSENSTEYGNLKTSLLWAFLGLFIVLGAKGILIVISNTVTNVLNVAESSDILLATANLLPHILC